MNGKTRVLTIINPSHFAIPLSSLNHGPSFWSNIFIACGVSVEASTVT